MLPYLPSLSSSECIAIVYPVANEVHILWLTISSLMPLKFDLNLFSRLVTFPSFAGFLSFVAIFFPFVVTDHVGLFLSDGRYNSCAVSSIGKVINRH